MFLRSYKRKKNGKCHEYFSFVENRRVANGKTVQRTVLYLGEISSSQENTWKKTLQVFDQDSSKKKQKLLFADNATITECDVNSIKVTLSQMQLCQPRSFGDCWLGCHLWQRLGLDEFWSARLDSCRSDIFGIEFDVLLYDLTSTYFEGLCEQNPKARFGYSRDNRSDCRQVVIALIVTPEGFTIGYEVLR